jgi:hypothetical protein
MEGLPDLPIEVMEDLPDLPIEGDAGSAPLPLTSFDCDAPVGPEEVVHEGDFVATSPTDINELSGFTRVTGDVTLNAGVAAIALENLACISGRLVVEQNETLESFSLPKLATVGYDPLSAGSGSSVQIASNPQLTNVDLGGLVSTENGVVISNNKKLMIINLDRLERVEIPWWHGMHVTGNDALVELALPALSVVATLVVAENASLERLEVPFVDVIAAIDITDNPKLKLLYFPSTIGLLADQSGLNNDYDHLVVTGNAALETISLPGLSGATQLTITENPSLDLLHLPAFESGCFATISSNPALPQCQADAVGDGVSDWMLSKCYYMTIWVSGGLVSENNFGTCP